MQGVAFFGEGGAGQGVNGYFAIDIPFKLFLLAILVIICCNQHGVFARLL